MTETNAATQQFRAWATPARYRVKRDAEGFPFIPGTHGQIEWYTLDTLAIFTWKGSRMIGKLLAIPGTRIWQNGDNEARLLCPLSSLDQAATAIQARRRRQMPPGWVPPFARKAQQEAVSQP